MFRSPISINFFYFGIFFLTLVFLSASNIVMKNPLDGSFFFLYAMGQAALEVVLLIVFGHWIERLLGQRFLYAFIGATFLLFILHICDFFMNRILDLSIWETISFVLDESLQNLIYMFEASGVPLWFWGCFFLFLLLLPFIGMLAYRLTNQYSVETNPEWVAQALCCIPASLFLWDVSTSRVMQPDQYVALTRLLPWKTTFLQPSNTQTEVAYTVKEPLSEEEVLGKIVQENVVLTKKPNLYLFVIESLREDFITEQIAPHLAQFRAENTHFDLAISGGNASQISWFSIFHSQHAYLWRQTQEKGWTMGSPALRLLKEWGYQIHLYTSADLNYYGMEELLFGEDRSLLTSHHSFLHGEKITAAESDQAAVEALRTALQKSENQEGQVFIVFLDSTHFGYSWLEREATVFNPVAHEFAPLSAYQSRGGVEKIKNRYRNAIHHIDALFGRFWSTLPQKEEALIGIIGDHGEEFFEQGHLFHNSHLVQQQMHVPLYLKLGNRPVIQRSVVSQIDIFPSFIDAIAGRSVAFLEGTSVLREATWPFAVTARYNAGRTPYEFSIQNGKAKMIARFSNRRNIFAPQHLILRSLTDSKDEPITCKGCAEEWVKEEFAPAFQRLFR